MPDSATFENYEILRRADGSLWELGRGAMGVTYKAVDSNLQCDVALKIINTEILRNDEAIQRFYREARSAAQLRHPNIAAVYHLGKAKDGSPFYAMEFCEGPTVQQLVEQKGPLDVAQALEITLQVTKALVIAEQHQVVHRDLKPANLIVTRRGDEPTVVKVIDFGLAKMGGDTSGWSSISGQGFIGTAHFSSPEQIEGRTVDTRSDIYSLGATLFFLLTGKPLFEGSAARIISQHLTVDPPYQILPPLPAGMLELIRKMLAKDPSVRPASATELKQQIQGLISGAPVSQGSKPPPLPSMPGNKDVAPGPPSTPPSLPSTPPKTPTEVPLGPVTLLDLMKARGVLTPMEALQLAEPLAKAVDENPDGSLVLIKQAVRIRFLPSPGPRAERDLLRQPVSEWPPFTLDPERLSPAEMPLATNPELTIASVGTIVPGLNSTSGSIGALGTLIYEMVGGTPSKRYVPVARLSEAQNLVLQRAIVSGAIMFTSAAQMVAKLHEDALDTRATPIITPTPSVPAEPAKPGPGSSSTGTIPSQPAVTTGPAKRSFFGTREGKQMALAGAGVLLLLFVIGVVVLYSWFKSSPSDSDKTKQTNVASQPQIPAVDPAKLPKLGDNNSKNALEDLKKQFLNQTNNNNNNQFRNQTPANGTQFVILNNLGNGEISESVYIYVNRAPIVLNSGSNGPSLTVSQYNKTSKLTITVPAPGYYELGANATATFSGGLSGTRQYQGSGSSKVYIAGGETFRLASSMNANGSGFTILFEQEK